MAAKVSPSESKEEIPRDLPSRLTTKQEGRNNNFQDIACRRRSVPPRILDPQEHMEPFGTSKSLNKTDRREQKNRETQWQEHRPQIWLVDKTEEKLSILRGRDSERKLTGSLGASYRKNWTPITERVTPKNGAESSFFFQNTKVFVIHMGKQNKPNRQNPAAPEGGCKLTGWGSTSPTNSE